MGYIKRPTKKTVLRTIKTIELNQSGHSWLSIAESYHLNPYTLIHYASWVKDNPQIVKEILEGGDIK